MKVGRTALDDEAIRLIEQLNPDVQFDWPRLLKGQGQPASEPRVPHDVRRARQDRRSQPRPPQSGPRPPAPQEPRADSPIRQESAEYTPRPTQEPEAPPVAEVPPEFVAPVFDDTPTPALGKLGTEGLARLRSRYAEILRRIPERTQDPTRREELRQQAQRLNPDSWASDDAVVHGLEEYEAVLASLKELVGQKRRRRRRGKGRSGPGARGDGSDASASTSDTNDGGSANGSTYDEGGDEDEGSGSPSSNDES